MYLIRCSIPTHPTNTTTKTINVQILPWDHCRFARVSSLARARTKLRLRVDKILLLLLKIPQMALLLELDKLWVWRAYSFSAGEAGGCRDFGKGERRKWIRDFSELGWERGDQWCPAVLSLVEMERWCYPGQRKTHPGLPANHAWRHWWSQGLRVHRLTATATAGVLVQRVWIFQGTR